MNTSEQTPSQSEPIASQVQQNPIITFLDQQRFPLLEAISQPCSWPLSPDDEQAIGMMDDILTSLDEEAAGLAAVQIGYPKQIFLLRNGVDADGKVINKAYINPIMLSKSTELKRDGEACLSLPGMGVAIKRSKKVKIAYTDLSGEVITEEFSGFWARACMHEMDHLEGKLIVNHLQNTLKTKKNKCGMVMDSAAKNRIAARRAANKKARKNRKLNR